MRLSRNRIAVLVALAVGMLTAGQATAVTIDGTLAAGEWDHASIVIVDPNEVDIPDSWDIERIRIAGGWSFDMAVEVWNDAPLLTSAPPVPTGRAFLNFDFNQADGPSYFFGLTLNDGKGFAPGELHLVQYTDATRTTFSDLGQGTFALGSAIELTLDWSLFPDIDPDGDGQVTFGSYAFLYNNGGIQPDDDSGNSDLERNDPVSTIPEPLTMTGFAIAAAATLPRILSKTRRASGARRRNVG